MSNINHAIELIRQGQKIEAQRILQEIIKTEPGNIPAWFWYVETCATTERRVQALETCLKMNPGNSQVMKVLQTLRSQLPAVQPKTTSPVYEPPSEPVSKPQPFTYSYPFEDEEKPHMDAPEDEDAFATFSAYSSTPIPVEPIVQQKKPWEMDSSDYTDDSLLSKPKPPARSMSFFDVWMTVTTVQDVRAYEDVLKDPEAGLGRAFTWVACAGLVNALVFPVLLMTNPQFSELMSMPEFRSITGSVNMSAFLVLLTVVMLLAIPIIGVINLAITSGLQNFLAIMFGGTGNYTRTVYALAAFLAPMTIVTSLAVMVPFVGQCLTFPLGIYNIVLNVRALRAAHSISTGAALGALFAPGIILFIFGCLIAFLVGGNLPAS